MRRIGVVSLALFFSAAAAYGDQCKVFPLGHRWRSPAISGTTAAFSPDGKSIIAGDVDGTVVIRDIKTGAEQRIEGRNQIRSAVFSDDGSRAVAVGSNGEVIVRDLKTRKDRRIRVAEKLSIGSVSRDGKSLIGLISDRDPETVLVRNLESGAERRIPASWGLVTSLSFSPDGRSIVIGGSDGSVTLQDLGTGSTQRFETRSSVSSAELSKDGNSLVIATANGEVKVTNLVTGQEQTTRHRLGATFAESSPDGKYLLSSGIDGLLYYRNLDTREEKRILVGNWKTIARFSPDGRSAIITSERGNIEVVPLEETCVDPSVSIHEPDCAGCRENPPLGGQEKLLSDVVAQNLCRAEFDAKPWDRFTEGPLTRESAGKYLLRFQKPGGFVPEKHLPILLAILRTDWVDKEPALVRGALQNVARISNRLYEAILALGSEEGSPYPNLATLTQIKPASLNCRTEKERDEFRKEAITYLHFVADDNGPMTTLQKWKRLGPWMAVLKDLKPAQKEEWIDRIAQSMADHAASDSESIAQGIFLSKLYKFTSQAVAPIFGEKSKPLTDFTLVREKSEVRPYILGVSIIDQDPESETPYGFYAKSLDTISVTESSVPLHDGKLTWTMGNKNYSADLKIEAKPKTKGIVPVAGSPNYDELWKEGLNGVVMTGSNMGIASIIMNEYLAYYQNRGFEFEEMPRELNDVPAFLKEQVESGAVDYMKKEAHSDGDEKNLFRMYRKGRVMTGVNKKTNEKVQLVFPDANQGETTLLSNEEFGEWIRSREKAGKGQLVYFNGSCWSEQKAIHEVEAAASPLLVDIASTTTTLTFQYMRTSGGYLMLQAFRDKKSYEQIRQELKKNPDNAEGIRNVYIFPDQAEYREKITDRLETPLNIRLRITGPDGKPYTIDEAS